MNNGPMAPQYGLGRITSPSADVSERPVARDEPHTANPAAGMPKVVVKRRRLLEGQDATFDGAVAPTPSQRAPKVFRLETLVPPVLVDAAAQPPGSEAPAEQATLNATTGSELPAATKPPRRRDAARKPTLLKHVVFEPSREARPFDSEAVPDNIAEVDFRAARDALKALDVELKRVARAQAAYRALDELLSSLGIASSTPERW